MSRTALRRVQLGRQRYEQDAELPADLSAGQIEELVRLGVLPAPAPERAAPRRKAKPEGAPS